MTFEEVKARIDGYLGMTANAPEAEQVGATHYRELHYLSPSGVLLVSVDCVCLSGSWSVLGVDPAWLLRGIRKAVKGGE
jgi:hypothetical protein